MEQDKFTVILPYICTDLVAMIAEKEEVSGEEALSHLYASELYTLLEQEDTKIWHYSTCMLYALYEQEKRTGTIEFPQV